MDLQQPNATEPPAATADTTASTSSLPGFYDLDIATGRTSINREYARMLGYDPDDFVLTPERWIELVHPDDRARVQAVFDACVEGRQDSYEIEYRMRTRCGEPRWIASVGRVAARGEDGRALRLVGTHLDISRRRAETVALRRSQAVLDNMRDGVFLLAAGGGIVYVNAAACRSLGYSMQELLSLRIFDIDPSFPPEAWEKHWQRSLGPGPQIIETQHRRKDGTLVPVEISVTPMEFEGATVHCAFSREASDRQLAEAALRKSEARFRTLFETMAQGVVYQAADGRITDANPAAQRILGMTLDQMQGRTSMHPEWRTLREDGSDFPGSEHPAMLALGSGRPRDGVMGVFHPGEQSYRWIQVHALPQFGAEAQRPDGVVSTFEDISALRRAEAKLRHITRQDQEALRMARMGHWELDLATQVFTFNDQYLSLHGLTAETAGGYEMPAAEFARKYVHPDDSHLVAEHIRQSIETRDPGFEIRAEARLLRADGEVRDMTVWFRIEKDVHGRTVKLYGVNQDITERRRAEQALREANLVVENSPVMLFRWKAAEGWPVVLVSHNVMQIGYSPEELLDGSVPFASLIHPQDLERVSQEVLAYASSGINQFQQEYRIFAKDQSVRWVDDRTVIERDRAGRVTHYQGIVIDITERKAAELLLRESEERLHQAVRVSEIGIFDHDHRSATIYWSPKLRAMYGWDADSDMDLPAFTALLHPDDRESVTNAIRRTHDPAGDGQYAAEYRIVTPSGELRWMTERGQTFFEGEGDWRQAVRTVGATVDITERKSAEEALRTLNATLGARVAAEVARNREKDHLLIQQSRLAAMGEMIGNIAHQWRQPINALSLLLSNLKDAQEFGELSPGYLGEQVERGHALIHGMSSTIDDFRNFFRPNREPQPFRLGTAVRDALAIVESAFVYHHIDIEVAVLHDATLLGFANEYSQVLLNLLTNAKEAIEARGVFPGHVRIVADCDAQEARLTVQDNGGGIPAAVLPKIFDPYFTTRDQGTGIGLYMSKMIIESGMRGRIEVGNGEEGARVSVITPLASVAVDLPNPEAPDN